MSIIPLFIIHVLWQHGLPVTVKRTDLNGQFY